MKAVQNALDILSSHVALLSADGVVLAVNKAWRDFSEESRDHGACVGVNYLDICQRSAEQGSKDAARTHLGLKRILNMASDDYGLAYESEGRIFRLRAKAVMSDEERQVLVSREDITDMVTAQTAVDAARASEARLAEELGQRLAAIGLAVQVLKRGAEPENAISTIELALEEAKHELKVLRQGHRARDIGE